MKDIPLTTACPAMDYSSLVAARPSLAPFNRASSRQRWVAVICAAMMFVACAALVATLGAPQRLVLEADISTSLSQRPAPADGSLPAIRFTALQDDPLDSALKKASARVAFAQIRDEAASHCAIKRSNSDPLLYNYFAGHAAHSVTNQGRYEVRRAPRRGLEDASFRSQCCQIVVRVRDSGQVRLRACWLRAFV